MGIGRGKVQRGIGKKTGTPAGYAKKSAGGGIGGNRGYADPGKGRQSKNMGSSGPKEAGPKYGRSTSSKRY